MSEDSSRTPSHRRPTRRSAHTTGAAHAHYSSLGRKPAAGTARHASAHAPSRRAGAQQGASSYENLSHGTRRKVYGDRTPHRTRGGGDGNRLGAALGLAVVIAFLVAGVLLWTHRKVDVTVNGEQTSIRIGSSLEDVHTASGVKTTPGDYVSVGGNVLSKGKGYAFAVSVDGTELSPKKAADYHIRGGEEIDFADGGNRMEAYDVEYREVQPKLVFQGEWGSVSYVGQWGKVGRQEIRTGRKSKEVSDSEWAEEVQDCVIVTKNPQPADGKKLVALTFDDGPSTYTEAYLKILEEHHAKATFFALGENVEAYPELARKVSEAGHQICNHSTHHPSLSTLDAEGFRSEIVGAHDIIKEATGVETTTIRPPYGDFDRNCWVMSAGAISASVLWNQDTLDWTMPGPDTIVNNALAGIEPGSVILMHDGGGARDQDVQALPTIIERLQSSGYELVTLSELLASDPDIPEAVVTGNATMPDDAIWPTEIGEATAEVTEVG